MLLEQHHPYYRKVQIVVAMCRTEENCTSVNVWSARPNRNFHGGSPAWNPFGIYFIGIWLRVCLGVMHRVSNQHAVGRQLILRRGQKEGCEDGIGGPEHFSGSVSGVRYRRVPRATQRCPQSTKFTALKRRPLKDSRNLQLLFQRFRQKLSGCCVRRGWPAKVRWVSSFFFHKENESAVWVSLREEQVPVMAERRSGKEYTGL